MDRRESFSIRTAAGPVTPTITSPRTCTMSIGRASTASDDYPTGAADGRGTLSAAGREWGFQHVSIGNPQCAIEVADGLEELDLGRSGPRSSVTSCSRTAPTSRSSASTADRVRARIFERGVGETLSSGTGASGAAVAAHLRGAPSPITVALDGGELEVEISERPRGQLSGWAEPVCSGELSAELLEALS